jgi:hypothetical protein
LAPVDPGSVTHKNVIGAPEALPDAYAKRFPSFENPAKLNTGSGASSSAFALPDGGGFGASELVGRGFGGSAVLWLALALALPLALPLAFGDAPGADLSAHAEIARAPANAAAKQDLDRIGYLAVAGALPRAAVDRIVLGPARPALESPAPLDAVREPCSDQRARMTPRSPKNSRPRGRFARSSLALALVAFAACVVDPGSDPPSTTSGGGAGGPPGTCEPKATEPCYTGPPGTEGVSLCKAGKRTCNTLGTAWSACLSEATPRDENCDTPIDDDCDGTVNEPVPSCCLPGTPVGCYTGPPETKWVGVCKAGTKVCNAEGTGYGPCEGEVLPTAESCETPEDDDCNGQVGGSSSCCEAGEVQPCYDGPAGTEGEGICQGGVRVCDDMGLGFGPCEGAVLPEVEDCSTLSADESCDGVPTCTGPHVFSKRFGNKNQTVVAAVDKNGSIFLAGSFDETMDIGGGVLTSAGSSDVYIARLNPSGGHAWSKRYGNASSQAATGIAVDEEGNLLVTGSFQGTIDFGGKVLTSAGSDDIFVAKLSASGGHLWSYSFGGVGSQGGLRVGVDSFEYVYLAGRFAGTLNLSEGPVTSQGLDDVFLAGLDPFGNLLWGKGLGDVGYDYVNGMAVEPVAGDVVVTGRFSAKIDFGDGALTSAGSDDVFLARLDYFGGPLWSKRFGDAQAQSGSGVALDPGGDLFFAGDFSGAVDFGDGPLASAGGMDIFVAKLTASGSPIWGKRFGDGLEQRVTSISSDATGNVVLTGYFQGDLDFGNGKLSSAGGKDIFIAKLSPSGDPLWSRRAGDASLEQTGSSVAVDNAGNVIGTGRFEGTMDFGGGPLVCQGTSNGFVVKLGP